MATAQGPGRNAGMQISGGSITIMHSKLSATGAKSALQQVGGSSIKVALSQLVGGIVASGNSLQCFDNYDENLAAVNCRSGASK